jgi:hypothetical protein
MLIIEKTSVGQRAKIQKKSDWAHKEEGEKKKPNE